MLKLWTKNGLPLSCRGNEVYAPSGTLVGRIRGDRVFRADDGRYVGTLVGVRLVFRSYDIDGPQRAYTRQAGDLDAGAPEPLRTWGDEPALPD